jgi:hypothetical protein
VTGPGVPDNEMCDSPWRTGPAVAAVLAALQAPPDDAELAGWNRALAAYRERAAVSRVPWRARRPFIAAAAAVALAALGSVSAAAYTGSLPGGLQRLAHETIAAPGASGSQLPAAPTGSGRPVEPSATGSSAYALCKRYVYTEQYGTASQQAVAYRNVVRAAGGPGRVAAYCALAKHPGAASPPGRRVGQTQPPAGHHGKPTAKPGNGNGNGNGNAGGNGNGNGHGKKS